MVSRTVFLFQIHGTQKNYSSGLQSQMVKGHPLCGLHLQLTWYGGHCIDSGPGHWAAVFSRAVGVAWAWGTLIGSNKLEEEYKNSDC